MPSKTPKQHKFMEAVKHSPAFAKKVGVSQSVGEEFTEADKKVRRFQRRKKALDKWASSK